MPRRFGVGSIMAVTVTYALVFSAATQLGASPLMMGLLFLLLLAVTAGQAVLFGGKRPRTASIVVGAVLFAVLLLCSRFMEPRPEREAATWLWGRSYPAVVETVFLCAFCGLGPAFGYLSGAVVGGTFVVLDLLGRLLNRPTQ